MKGIHRNFRKLTPRHLFYTVNTFGALAQLGERCICNAEVTGSIPVGSIGPVPRKRGRGNGPCAFHPTERKIVVEIQLEETDRLDWALKQFRRRMIRSGLFKDMRRKRFYEKPSEARKAKAKAAERRRHKERKRENAARRFGM